MMSQFVHLDFVCIFYFKKRDGIPPITEKLFDSDDSCPDSEEEWVPKMLTKVQKVAVKYHLSFLKSKLHYLKVLCRTKQVKRKV